MKSSAIQFTSAVAVIAAAGLISGCCGPRHDRTTAYYHNTGATTQYSSTAESPRTYVSEKTETAKTTTTTENMAGNEWSLPLYSESLRVGKREVDNGSVRLRKVVHTENANQPVDLRRETVVIDRQAFDQAQQAANAGQPNEFGMAFQEKEITIDLKREEPVVELQQFVSGRIVAQKRTQTEHQNIARQVRTEDVEVIKNGNDRDITVSERVHMGRNEAVGAPGNLQNRQTGTGTSQQIQKFDEDQGDNVDETNPDNIEEPTDMPRE